MDELERLRQDKIRQLLERGIKMTKPVELTDGNFNEKIGENQLMVVDFWAPWCAPCRMLGPVIGELAQELSGKITFGKLNVDDNAQTSAQYGIMSIPTLLVFKNGELADRITGALPKEMLKKQLSKHIN
ncbi:MAG TPA: thioredoxin [Candidatus Altiarchaeales archaeon]|nr:thioredoxin [Candidatus Altiarchaeales archaeon]